MKKFLSIALVLALVLSFGVTAFASSATPAGEEIDPATYTEPTTVTISKKYTAPNGGKNPAETFAFSDLTCIEVTDAAEGVTKANAPVPTIASIAFTEGEATADGVTKTAAISLPTYTSVGVYTYEFNEEIPETKTAGVTYNETKLYLVVTVIQGSDGLLRVAAVHCEGSHDKGKKGQEPKTDLFDNKYENGTLAVTKTVTGNMGDKSKYFDVTVTFTAASGEAINSTITYKGGQYTQAVTVENNTATIKVKHGDTVTFENVPEGVTWKVEEASYTSEGYDAAQYSTQTKEMAAGANDTCTITNNKTTTVDTGITLDSLPYILIVAVVLSAAVVMFINKRRSEV